MTAGTHRGPFYKSLSFKVLLAIRAGVILGVLSPSNVNVVPESLHPLLVPPSQLGHTGG